MRFFILFLLCLLASGPLGAGSAQAAPQKGFLPQILDSVEGLSPCKPGGDITRDVGRWLRLMRLEDEAASRAYISPVEDVPSFCSA